ncbi:hypothetical protein C467_12242 [Halorubrum hochstenium ATCC 700873]|uniref:LamG-like jellyroll fold domain-containing protein n=1 Tax=Halorubrum hochstenium ATCC 700873 TaxID=1227481 RepID=M0F4D0_9EURY|nr:hypothetical protein C467_12242 [Halorubrum hochstenium ATCC 700873]
MGRKWTRRSAIALIAGGAGLSAWNSNGSVAIRSDRDADLSTSNDSEALLGVSGPETVVGYAGERVQLREITNRSDEPIDVSIDAPSAPLRDISAPDDIEPEESAWITATLDCPGEKEEVAFTIFADGETHRFEADRDVTVVDPRVSYWNPRQSTHKVTIDDWDDCNRPKNDGSPVSFADSRSRDRVFDYLYEKWKKHEREKKIEVGSDDSLNLDGEFTLSVWVLPGNRDGTGDAGGGDFGLGRLFSKWGSDQSEKSYQLFIGSGFDGSEQNTVFIEVGPDSLVNTDSTLDDGWNHVAWCHGSNDRVYINGEMVYEPTSSLPDPQDTQSPLLIGNGPDGDYQFRGALDNPQIHSIALSGDQVKRLYETSQDGSAGTLVPEPSQ